MSRNRRIVLAARPDGAPKETDFRLEEGPVPTPEDGEILLRTLYFSLDPYMRSRMNEAGAGYAPGVELGGVMPAGGVSEVIRSRAEGFEAGDVVNSFTGWQTHSTARASSGSLRRIDPANAPVSTAVGVLGMPGMTAYMGLLWIGQPKEGETVAVSAASGAVGAVVGQIARMQDEIVLANRRRPRRSGCSVLAAIRSLAESVRIDAPGRRDPASLRDPAGAGAVSRRDP